MKKFKSFFLTNGARVILNYLDNTRYRRSNNNLAFSKYLLFKGINFCFPPEVPDLHKPKVHMQLYLSK